MGLYLVDESQIYETQEAFAEHQQQWQKISKKGVKGYNFKDFQKDVFYLLNPSIIERTDAGEV